MANFSEGENSNSTDSDLCSYWSYASYEKTITPKGICPVCKSHGTLFYCHQCVKNGAFIHSRRKSLERFSDKKLKVLKLNEEKLSLIKKYQTLLDKKIQAEKLKNRISLCRDKNHLLQECIRSSNEEITKLEKSINHLKDENERWNIIKLEFRKKLQLMENNCNALLESVFSKKLMLAKEKEELKKLVRETILLLTNDIFYISKVEKPKSHQEILDESQRTALADAQQTTYVKDHWEVMTSSENETLYRIVKSCIPGNGDYSAYFKYTSNSLEVSASTEQKMYDKNIGAALNFITHFVILLYYYLDIPYPKPLSFNEFCNGDLDEKSFRHKVAKLNTNVINLCLHQNVNPALIKPERTIENLLLLLDPSVSDLGRCGPVDSTQTLCKSKENVILEDLLLNEEEIEPGWVDVCETIDISNVPVYCAPEIPPQTSQGFTSYAGALLRSSVASLWQGNTTKK